MTLTQKQAYISGKKIEIPEISPHEYGQMILDRDSKSVQWIMESLQQKVLEHCTAICKRMKLNSCFIVYTKINSKLIKDLNVRA